MNLVRLEELLAQWVKNDEYEPFFKEWMNSAVDEVAADYELPDLKLRDPVGFVCKETEWLYTVPGFEKAWVVDKAYVSGNMVSSDSSNYRCILGHTSGAGSEPGSGASWETYWELTASNVGAYQKKLFEARDSDYNTINIRRRSQDIRIIDPDHSETGDNITDICIEDKSLMTYPMATETIFLWYWRRPTPMVESYDVPEGIPEDFHERVIIPKTMIKVFEMQANMTFKPAPFGSLEYWRKKYREGVLGSDLGDPGMVNFFSKSTPPRRRGGRNPLP
uniref:Putative tail tubular protein n=1 Tax=viral metagenome TaxID=1070528 RepID=A0A6M3IFK3_9ZZZZ